MKRMVWWVLMGWLLGCGPKAGSDEQAENESDDGACPRSTLDDIWLDRRLGCLQAGQQVGSTLREAPGEVADRAFIVSQHTYDTAFDNVLGSDVERHFQYLVCARNVGADVMRVEYAVPFSTELSTAFRVNASKPAAVGGSTIRIAGGSAGMPVVEQACDPAAHPLIIDTDGRLESVNADALGSITIFDSK